MKMVEMTHMTESMLQLIQRQYLSTYTDRCWTALTDQACNIFPGRPHDQRLLVYLAGLCKMGSLELRLTSKGDPVAKDLANKLLSLASVS